MKTDTDTIILRSPAIIVITFYDTLLILLSLKCINIYKQQKQCSSFNAFKTT